MNKIPQKLVGLGEMRKTERHGKTPVFTVAGGEMVDATFHAWGKVQLRRPRASDGADMGQVCFRGKLTTCRIWKDVCGVPEIALVIGEFASVSKFRAPFPLETEKDKVAWNKAGFSFGGTVKSFARKMKCSEEAAQLVIDLGRYLPGEKHAEKLRSAAAELVEGLSRE